MKPTSLRSLYHRDLRNLRKEIEAFKEEDLWRTSNGVINSGGNLCLHICGNLRHYIGHVMGCDDFKRNRTQEFKIKHMPKEELLGLVDQTLIAVDHVLGSLSEEAFNAPYPGELPVDAENTCEFLLHLYGHLNYHLGQINHLRRTITT
jgi:uncharacterized damage-inducible protein DinB